MGGGSGRITSRSRSSSKSNIKYAGY
jgi:hypothetical protein